uniref:DUF4704 domain-containing protein n=1 Tax=Rhabditophanes sp. KR3021 TaxID=114890 RepID=A0AC35U5N7_9BILA
MKAREKLHAYLDNLAMVLFRHKMVTDELILKDDLPLAFIGASSPCASYNAYWRDMNFKIVRQMFENVLTPTLAKYIHVKECMRHYLRNLENTSQMEDEEQKILVTNLITLLKVSTKNGNLILEHFAFINGYGFLACYVNSKSTNQSVAVDVAMAIVNDLVYFGAHDLHPIHSNNLSITDDFVLPKPLGCGLTVRNIDPIKCLFAIFSTSQSKAIDEVVGKMMLDVYSKDVCNYFIIEKECPFSQFVEAMYGKDIPTQAYFFEILEMLTRDVKYAPTRELVILSVSLRNQMASEEYVLSAMYLKRFFVLLTLNPSLKGLFRELGFIDTFSWVFNVALDISVQKGDKKLYSSIVLPAMDLMQVLIRNCPQNAQLLSEHIEIQKVIDCLCFDQENGSNNLAQFIKSMIIFVKNEKYLRTIIKTMYNNSSNFTLNIILLQTLLSALRESHKVRISFRKADGYICLIYSLLNYETFFADPQFTPEFHRAITYMSITFKVITLSMRFEPSNAKYFLHEIKHEMINSILRLSGAFTQKFAISYQSEKMNSNIGFTAALKSFHCIFKSANPFTDKSDELTVEIPNDIIVSCYFLKLLLELSLDSIEKVNPSIQYHSLDKIVCDSANDSISLINIGNTPIVHTGALLSFVSLLASIPTETSPFLAATAQFYGFILLKDCLKEERNQQIMCSSQLPKLLLEIAEEVFNNEAHLLYTPILYVFERLSRQQIFPRDLKKFLRLGNPLCCRDLDFNPEQCEKEPDTKKKHLEGGTLDFFRVKTLASMLTPRYNCSPELPAFIEFDMSHEGFAAMLLPSIVPQYNSTTNVNPSSHIFPPLNGLTFSTWIYIHGKQNESTPSEEQIPSVIPLIDIFRSFKNDKDDSSKINFRNMISCFNAELNVTDMKLTCSTHESDLIKTIEDVNNGNVIEGQVSTPVKHLVKRQQWVHIVIVLTRSVLKNSLIEIYVNKELVNTQKAQYISANSIHPIAKVYKQSGVHALIGVAPFTRKLSNLKWKTSSLYLFEEPLTGEAIKRIYDLEAHYVGNFQALEPDGSCLISEDKILVSLNASAQSECSVVKLKNMYPKADADILASLMSVSTNDNSTPIRVIWNTVCNGTTYDERCYGAVTIGYLGIRVFQPLPASKILSFVGGQLSILGLIAMSTSSEELYISLKALLSAVQTSLIISEAMLENRGYQMLAMLLEDKGHLMNANILHLIISLTGTACANVTSRRSLLKSREGFEDLLCDLDVWAKSSENFKTILFEHLYEMIIDPQRESAIDVKRSSLLPHLLIFLLDSPSPITYKSDVIFNLITVLIQGLTDLRKILCYGQAVAGTIPSNTTEQVAEEVLPFLAASLGEDLMKCNDGSEIDRKVYFVYVRNRLLNILFTAISNSPQNISFQMCDAVVKGLGFDWLFAFFAPSIHSCTIFTAFRILLEVIKHPSLYAKFKNGQSNGEWLADADSATKNRVAVLLGFSVSNPESSYGVSLCINKDVLSCGGFEFLSHLLPNHYEKPFMYIGILGILFNQTNVSLTVIQNLTAESIWSEVFSLTKNASVSEVVSTVDINREALLPLLNMINMLIHYDKETRDESHWTNEWSRIIIQLLIFFYQTSHAFYTTVNSPFYFVQILKTLYIESNGVVKVADMNCASVKMLYDFLALVLVNDLLISHEGEVPFLLDSLIESVNESSVVFSNSKSPFSSLMGFYLESLKNQQTFINYKVALIPKTVKLNYDGTSILSNIFYTTSRLIDSCWSGYVFENTYKILQILLKAFSETKLVDSNISKNNPALDDAVINSFFRIVLFILSRPINNCDNQLSVLDTLSQLLHNVQFISTPHSSNSNFIGPLVHLIFVLSETPDLFYSTGQNVELEKGSAQISVCARSVWEMIYNYRKAFLNDLFKNQVENDLLGSRVVLGGAANGYWLNFLDSQQDIEFSNGRFVNVFKSQFGARLTRMGSTFSKFTSKKGLTAAAMNAVSSAASVTSFSTSISKEASPNDASNLNRSDSVSSASFNESSNSKKDSPVRSKKISKEMIHTAMKIHICFVKEAINSQISNYHEYHNHVRKWCMLDWEKNRAELTRPRGLWGPDKCSEYDKYQLSTVEGPCRIRKKTIPDETFYHRYPYRPQMDSVDAKSLRNKIAICKDSKQHYEKMHAIRFLTMDERIIDKSLYSLGNNTNNVDETNAEESNEINFSMIRRIAVTKNESKEEDEIEEGEIDKKDTMQNSEGSVDGVSFSNQKQRAFGPDNQSLLRLLEQGEQLHSMFRCARVQGLDTMEGLLLFGKEHCYIIDGFTLLKTREIRDLEFLPEQYHDPIVPYTALGGTNRTKSPRQCHKIGYDEISSVHKRRYMLQPISIEVFCTSGENFLLALPKRTRNRVHQKFTSISKKDDSFKTSTINQMTATNKRFAYGEQIAGTFINSLIGQQTITQKWVRGETSNFEYLIYLNTVSGRSYNDLSQYPVFPWIIKDYTSDTIDLKDPKIFRDLSKPMGAQSPDRLAQFLKRYCEWDDPSQETPPYMYGTHYSSAMIVLSFLVRVEPFTTQFLKLQGGHFDLADRMFHSISDSWLSASQNNMADVRELIPEFYYLPELFKNDDKFDFGVKQNGIQLDNVVLPPWAKNDATEFVRIHREALESDYISEHLHEWIDLIFGYKQTAEEAVKANNVFHHLFYEGSVDFDNIDDPLTKNATLGFINNFGQIPTQLFKKPHPQRKPQYMMPFNNGNGSTSNLYFYHNLDALKPYSKPVKELGAAIGTICFSDKGHVIALEHNKIMINNVNFISWGFNDKSIKLGSVENEKSMTFYELNDNIEISCMVAGTNKLLFGGLITGGIDVWNFGNKWPRLKFERHLLAHNDAVTTMIASKNFNLLVSGARDGSVILWDPERLIFIRQLDNHMAPITAIQINETTGDIATAAGSVMYLWSINGKLLTAIDTSDSELSTFSSRIILCLSFSTINEWDSQNVIMCGRNDGLVLIYSTEIVREIANDLSKLKITNSFNENMPSPKLYSDINSIKEQLLNKGNRLRHLSISSLTTDREDSSLDGFQSPITSTSDHTIIPNANIRTLITSSTNNSHVDKLGYKRELVLRKILGLHTAFNKLTNQCPAPITAILPAKDHKKLYIGDGVGRILLWAIDTRPLGEQ